MLIDVLLGIVFFGSCYLLWYSISEKIPQVIAIPDEVITQRLHENSARLRIFLLHLKTFYKEEYYLNLFWNFLGKIFYKLHIFVLRFDNFIILILKKIRARNGFSGLFINEQTAEAGTSQNISVAAEKKTDNYWNALRENSSAATAQKRTHARMAAQRYGAARQEESAGKPRKRNVEGVRVRTRKSPIKSGMPG